MANQGIDPRTGEIWLAECTAPIRPFTPLQDFLQKFESFGAFRDPAQLKQQTQIPLSPFPICRFDRTFCVGGVHFSIALQFSDIRKSAPRLQNIRMFARRAKWKRDTGFLVKVRRFVSSNPLMVGLPQGFDSMDEQRSVYEKWLRDTVAQTVHEQMYPWGYLRLLNSRNECYHLQLDYFD
jgi:hypothetical protein